VRRESFANDGRSLLVYVFARSHFLAGSDFHAVTSIAGQYDPLVLEYGTVLVLQFLTSVRSI
jgi:hypothetical protein